MRAPFLCLATLLAAPAVAQTPLATQDGITVAAQTVATGLDQPVFLTAPPGDPRLFIVEKTGRIWVIADGKLASQPFLDLASQITTNSEQGLLGLAFHPGFAANQRFFVYFTDLDGAITVAEGLASAPATLTVLLTVPHDQADNHNGGWLGFGPDGLLYIGTGDGGRGGDPWDNAQNPDVNLGKLLRIDVDTAKPYAIPPTNPFAGGGGAPEIFALGLRNPWRAAFDGNLLYIADVGQGEFEEVNIVQTTNPGANFGWNLTEGAACFKSRNCDRTGLTDPVHTYDHAIGCSITGGYVYRGSAMPALQGRYLFSDFCSGTLMSFRLQDGQAQNVVGISDGLASLGQVASFGQDAAGELYILTFDGTVSKLVPAKN
jgi:glucose/arabinose dehydrogenase